MSFIGRTPTNAALTSSDLADGIVGTAKIAADAVTDAKIADDVVGTEHLTANEVDTAALGADAVTSAQLADDAVDSEHYTDGSIDTAHLADGQVTTAKLATAVFTGATDIGAAIVDADLFLMDDGAGGTIRKTTAARLKTYAGFDADAAQVFNESGADVDFRVETDSNINGILVDAGNNVVNILGSSTRRDGGLNVNVASSVLGTDGGAQIYCRTQETDTSNNATVDVFRFLDAAGNQMGNNYVNGILYCSFGIGANSFTVNLSIQTAGNSAGTLTELGKRTRGTSLVTANPVLPNDGSGGAVKVRITYINNSGVVANQKCIVTFIGQCV